MPSIRLLLCFLASLSLLPVAGGADPRWWWHDRALAPVRDERAEPHVTAAAMRDGSPGPVFVVWSERDPTRSQWDLWLTGTPNDGCGFCPPVRLTDSAADEIGPRIAAAEEPLGGIVVQVVFHREVEVGVIWTEPLQADPDLASFCAGLDPAVDPTAQRSLALPAAGVAYGSPDIAAAVPRDGSMAQFHAVWEAEQNGAREVFHSFDLTGGGGVGWESPAALLGGLDTPPDGTQPSLAADSFATDEGDTGVSVVFRDPSTEVPLHLRSMDAGRSWSESEVVSDGGGPAAGRPGVAALVYQPPPQPEAVSWVAAAWLEDRALARGVFADVQFTFPGGGVFPWFQDREAAPLSADAPVGASIAMVESASAPGQADGIHVFWDQPMGIAREVLHRAGTLCAICAIPQAHLTQTPFPAVRPRDSFQSEPKLLTGCAFDDLSFACIPSRPSGQADQAASAGRHGSEEVYVVWRDSREGVPNIWFKRTDIRLDAAPRPALAAGCDAAGAGRLHVQWSEARTCEASGGAIAERLERFLVYYARAPGGPYENADTPLLASYDPTRSDYEVAIEGLALDTDYWVVVVPEDEARNVQPAAFDPEINQASPAAESQIRTPPACAGTCLYRTEVAQREELDPALVFLMPRTPEDVALQGSPYLCPVGPVTTDAGAVGDGSRLTFYQLGSPDLVVRVQRRGSDVDIVF